jgi:hypothetical protein
MVREVLQGEEMYEESSCTLFFKGKSIEVYYISNTALFIIEQEILDKIFELNGSVPAFCGITRKFLALTIFIILK